jgi:hypothetical protein
MQAVKESSARRSLDYVVNGARPAADLAQARDRVIRSRCAGNRRLA